jgi:hypothetical protein
MFGKNCALGKSLLDQADTTAMGDKKTAPDCSGAVVIELSRMT